jgi:hypothetical protein
MGDSVEAIYDFVGNSELGELSFSAGTVITVVNRVWNNGNWHKAKPTFCIRMLVKAGGKVKLMAKRGYFPSLTLRFAKSIFSISWKKWNLFSPWKVTLRRPLKPEEMIGMMTIGEM